jgi:hypothetical protein
MRAFPKEIAPVRHKPVRSEPSAPSREINNVVRLPGNRPPICPDHLNAKELAGDPARAVADGRVALPVLIEARERGRAWPSSQSGQV